MTQEETKKDAWDELLEETAEQLKIIMQTEKKTGKENDSYKSGFFSGNYTMLGICKKIRDAELRELLEYFEVFRLCKKVGHVELDEIENKIKEMLGEGK